MSETRQLQLLIDDCVDCPYRRVKVPMDWCLHPEVYPANIPNSTEICVPDWCPLELEEVE